MQRNKRNAGWFHFLFIYFMILYHNKESLFGAASKYFSLSTDIVFILLISFRLKFMPVSSPSRILPSPESIVPVFDTNLPW